MNGPVAPARHPLHAYLRLEVGACAAAVVALLIAGIALREGYLLFVGGLVTLAGAGFAAAERVLSRRGAPTAVWLVSVINWSISVAASAIATYAMPLLVIAAIVPAVVAASFVSTRQLRSIAMLSIAVCVACAAIARLQDFSRLEARTPEWLQHAVVIGFMAPVAALVVGLALQTHGRILHSLDEAVRTNALLTASEQRLREQADELRASRARLVAATDDERRRIERNIHDGAQQRFVALAVRLRLATRLAVKDPARCQQLLDDLVSEAQAGVSELRELAHGVFPPVLAENGLVQALDEATARMVQRCRLETHRIGRYAPEVETAVYFACMEALQNAGKHAGDDATVVVRLTQKSGILRFEVSDDGPGFDDASTRTGTGLNNLRDRLGAIGGNVATTPERERARRSSARRRPTATRCRKAL